MRQTNDQNFQRAGSGAPGALFVFICILFLSLFTLFCIPADAHAKTYNKYAALVMDADTGLVLYHKNANKRLHPASLTKMMTMLMVFDALDRGTLRLNDRIYISKHAATMIPSKIGLKPGSAIKVKDAIYALATKSANDIAVALAEKLGGSEKNFALMMTRKARTFGMSKTRFMNASGLHDPLQVSTARDMAKLGRILIKSYPKHYHYFSAKSFTYQGKTYRSHNKLLNTYAGMDGLKTGYIRQSGFNIVTSAERNNRRLIGVVFGGKTSKSRNAHMEKLLNRGFAKLGTIRVAKYRVPLPPKKPPLRKNRVALNIISPDRPLQQSRWAMLDADDDNSVFNRMIGQGDYDIAVRNRIETGLIAVSVHTGQDIPSYIFNGEEKVSIKTAAIPQKSRAQKGDWAIQVGAYASRQGAYKAVIDSLKKLPPDLRYGHSTIAPLQTEKKWIFRGRLHGYSKVSANKACRVLSDCIVVPAHSYKEAATK